MKWMIYRFESASFCSPDWHDAELFFFWHSVLHPGPHGTAD